MKTLLVSVALLHLSWAVAQTQEPSPPPPYPAALSPMERIERQNAIDSLAAGRLRWDRVSVVMYRLETHYECFCWPDPDRREHRRNLLTIRNGRVMRRDVGKTQQHFGPSGLWWAVDRLFSVVAADLQDVERKVRRLELSPQYGFPMRYEAGNTLYEDTWINIAVDSFAVIRTAKKDRRPPR
jgi:hypothetical protein